MLLFYAFYGTSALSTGVASYVIYSNFGYPFVALLAGGSPAATHFLCFAKESKQRKATPTVCVPSLRYGQPAVLASGGVRANSLRSNSARP